jgi:hypothetical protein
MAAWSLDDLSPRERASTARQEPRERQIFAMPAALLLHLLLALAVWFSPAGPATPPVGQEAVPVEILTPEQFEAAVRPKAPPPVLAAPQAPAAAAPARPPQPSTADGMIAPTKMLSAQALDDPRSRKAKAALATLDGTERMVQLCDLEAMEQIHAWQRDFEPELVVPYATRNETIAGTTITADGAAFRSHDEWYGAGFKCRLSRDGKRVVAFRFQVGDPIPRERWTDLDLPSGPDLD